LALVNLMILYTFSTLFTPAAARLHARGDNRGFRELYWRTTAWISLMSFPAFALMVAFPREVMVATLGHRYAGSASYLALVSTGYYISAMLGFNGVAIQILGRVRFQFFTSIATFAVMGLLDVVLIPRYGAAGAAVAVLLTLVFSNVAKQVALRFPGERRTFDPSYLPLYVDLAVGVVVAAAVHALVPGRLLVGVACVVTVTLTIVRRNSRLLGVSTTIPELTRVPGVRWLVTA
jgi:O-antigen/teichoic acid export membrane protein